jgi:hypothetical protein
MASRLSCFGCSLGAIWIENSEPIGRDGRNPLNFFEKMERMDRIYIEILSIRIAGFLVRVQVEEQIQGLFPKRDPDTHIGMRALKRGQFAHC